MAVATAGAKMRNKQLYGKPLIAYIYTVIDSADIELKQSRLHCSVSDVFKAMGFVTHVL